MFVRALVLLGLAACVGVTPRYPDDVQTALARDSMRKAETAHLIVYYPEQRRDEMERFLVHAERCVDALQEAAFLHDGAWHDKMVVVMPEVAFNNAFVIPSAAGLEAAATIPTLNTLDFTTEFGIPPDPGFIACHELTHYVQFQQISGFWRFFNNAFGAVFSPQVGYEPWLLEGLATHYETALNPGAGRPQWPVFTGMFAAAYAGKHVGGGDMSSFGREAVVGHHYLVGTMFIRFLTETYGERPLWQTIGSQASGITGLFFTGTFKDGYATSFTDLLDKFDAWCGKTFPARARPAGQRELATVGNDARYARGLDGTEAWVADDVDAPARLVVRDGSGRELASLGLVDILPPRTLVIGDPLFVTGLSITADGNEVWMSVLDLGATDQVTRLVRWRRGDATVTEIATDLGPGATISPDGKTYYYLAVDGDRWSLAAYDVATRAAKVLHEMAPGTYVLGATISPDGAHLAASVYDHGFAVRVFDARGVVERTIRDDKPVYDPSFTSDGRLMWLATIDGRFQVVVEGHPASDAPYAALYAREAHGTIRFLDREGWYWMLDEIATPASQPPIEPHGQPIAPGGHPVEALDGPTWAWDHFFFPQTRGPSIVAVGGGVLYGLTVGGGDRLGLQRWSLTGYVQPSPASDVKTHFGGQVAYLNEMMAPLALLAQASSLEVADPIMDADNKIVGYAERRERDVSLTAARVWRGSTQLAFTGIYTEDFNPLDFQRDRFLGGPSLSLAYVGAESTRYTGIRRGVFASGFTSFYPKDLSSFGGDIADLGAEVGGVIPLPFGRRHTLTLSARGRELVSDHDTGLLQLGGDSGVGALFNGSSVGGQPGYNSVRFPPGLRFFEPLRGYEDFAITTDRATIADISWRYPIIIDKGIASLWKLPASFIRELDLEAFASAALDKSNASHGAVGGALSLHIVLFRAPLVLTYQLARRLYDDHAITQLVALAPDL